MNQVLFRKSAFGFGADRSIFSCLLEVDFNVVASFWILEMVGTSESRREHGTIPHKLLNLEKEKESSTRCWAYQNWKYRLVFAKLQMELNCKVCRIATHQTCGVELLLDQASIGARHIFHLLGPRKPRRWREKAKKTKSKHKFPHWVALKIPKTQKSAKSFISEVQSLIDRNPSK